MVRTGRSQSAHGACLTFPPMAAHRPISVPLRRAHEALVYAALGVCGLFTLAVTGTIIAILSKESFDFFTKAHPDAQGQIAEQVSVWEFLTGLQWTPLLGAEKHFGIWPLVLGTLKVTCVAMAFALPCGLITAVWLSEYAAPRTRAVIKPVLELLAGVPTVVFGFFALSVITPSLQALFKPLGISFGVYNALSAGIAVGILCLPIVVSMAEDTLRAVPKALREGCYGLGASKFETSVKVVVPAAMSGIIAAFLLAISRAVGETMVVALAAGSKPIEMTRPIHDGETYFSWAKAVDHLTSASSSTSFLDSTATSILSVILPMIFAIPLGVGIAILLRMMITLGFDHARAAFNAGKAGMSWTSLRRFLATCVSTDQPASGVMNRINSTIICMVSILLAATASIMMTILTLSIYSKGLDYFRVAYAYPTSDAQNLAAAPTATAWGNIFALNADVQAMTGYMVERFRGDAPHGTVEFSSSYVVAATLFVITLGLTVLGNQIRRRFRHHSA